MSALILPNSTILPQPYLLRAKYSLSCLSSAATVIASICCSLNSIHSIKASSSLVLNPRHTTATTLFDTLLLRITKCVYGITTIRGSFYRLFLTLGGADKFLIHANLLIILFFKLKHNISHCPNSYNSRNRFTFILPN